MKKLLSLLLCVFMLCTMFTCLAFAEEAEATTAPVRGFVGKQLTGFNNADWTVSVADAITDENGTLKAPKSTGYATATTNALYTFDDQFEMGYNFVWGGYNNYYGDVVVTFGTNEIRVGNIDKRATKNYHIVVSNSTGVVATALLGDNKTNIGGTYAFTYADGVLAATVNGNAVAWIVGEETAEDGAVTTLTAETVEVAFDEAKAVPVSVSVGGNYCNDRFVKAFKVSGTVNGDVDFDGEITSADLLAAQQALLGVENAAPGEYCDNTYDDVLTAGDILSLTHHVLGNGLMARYERAPVNIMCVGDSITAGAGTLSAWRYALFEKLYSYGANFNLVGAYTTNADFRLPEGYRGHSGVGGDKTEDVVNRLDTYMAVDFDVFAMMIGTNDSDKNITATLTNYRTILDRVYATNPNAYVYISTMCPKRNTVTSETWLNFGINPYLPTLVEEYTELGYHIAYVDNFTNYEWSTDDFPATDTVHPNEQGREKIADAFYQVMKDDVKALDVKEISFNYDAAAVTDMTLSDSAVSIEVGAAKSVIATIAPFNAQVKTVLWSSDNEAVATVGISGRITGVSVGTAKITAKSLDGAIVKTVDVTVTESTEVASTQLFNETFESLDNWVIADPANTYFKITSNTCATSYSNGLETMTTANTYTFTNGFEISFDYKASTNEEVHGDTYYGAVGYAGYELRVSDCGRKLILVTTADNAVVATYKTVANIEYVHARLVYKDNTLTAYYDGEAVISVSDVTIEPVASAITYSNGEKYRNTSADNIYLGSF